MKDPSTSAAAEDHTRLPAFCDACNLFFQTRFAIRGNIKIINLAGNKVGPCPKCGGMGRFLDGQYSLLDQVFSLLSGPTATIEALRRVSEIFEEARDIGTPPSEVLQKLDSESEQIHGLRDLIPTSRAEFYALLGLLLPLLFYLISLRDPPNLSEEQITRAVARGTQTAAVERNPEKRMTPPPKLPLTLLEPRINTERQSRGSMCLCGSGKKYKRCCGSGVPSPADRLMQPK